jgi:hypothetical protein
VVMDLPNCKCLVVSMLRARKIKVSF